MAVRFGSYSMYKNTSISNLFRSYFEPINITKDPRSDVNIVIKAKYHHKPGLLAFDMYGSSALSWIFVYYNMDKMDDPIYDLIEGLEIIVPDKERLLRIL